MLTLDGVREPFRCPTLGDLIIGPGGQDGEEREAVWEYGLDVHYFNYPSLKGTLDHNAKALFRFVDRLGKDGVHVVGHSLGGVVALRMLAKQTDAPAGRLVCLGSPLTGSRAAEFLHGQDWAAGLLGVKNTPLLLPDCHPLPIEYTGIEYDIAGLEIKIRITVKTNYKTGVEVEAMHGASVVALNMYDMLKPIDKGVEIHTIKLLKKTGGKSDIDRA